MKKVVVVPFSERDHNNKCFTKEREDNIYYFFKLYFAEYGYEMITYDLVCEEDIDDVEYVLICLFNPDIIWKYRILGKKMIYLCTEPEVVLSIDSIWGMKYLTEIFDYILTPFKNLQYFSNQNIRMGKSKVLPYYGIHSWKLERNGWLPFAKREILVNISGYKFSKNPQEMYSTRVKIIQSYENKPGFDFYGQGDWKVLHSKNYKGTVEENYNNKFECYHHYRFALALENSNNLPEYYTEKICDCFRAGIVPIYNPFKGLEKIIPASCYIDFNSFDNYEELWNYLVSMSEDEWYEYIHNMDMFLRNCSSMYNREVKVIESNVKYIVETPTENRQKKQLKTEMYLYSRLSNNIARKCKRFIKKIVRRGD